MADESLAAAEARLPSGPKYTYKFPESVRQLPTDPKTVTLQLVLLGQQQEAEKAAAAKGTSPVWETLKYSLVAVDDRVLGWDGAAKEVFLEGLSPKLRTQIALAFSRLHNPTDKEDADFFGSMTVTI